MNVGSRKNQCGYKTEVTLFGDSTDLTLRILHDRSGAQHTTIVATFWKGYLKGIARLPDYRHKYSGRQDEKFEKIPTGVDDSKRP